MGSGCCVVGVTGTKPAEGEAMNGGASFFEMGVPDADRARAFYGALFDWTFHPTGEGPEAWIETPPAAIRGGVHGGDHDAGIEIYFSTSDIEATCAKVRQLGGTADSPGDDTPGFGRFTRCTDDQGVRFGLHQEPTA